MKDNRSINPNAFDTYSRLTNHEIAEQIMDVRGKLDKVKEVLPPEKFEIFSGRLEKLEERFAEPIKEVQQVRAATVSAASPTSKVEHIDSHAGRAVSGIVGARETAKAVEAVIHGDYGEAASHAVGAAMAGAGEAMQHEKVVAKAAELLPKSVLKGLGTTVEVVGKKIPVVGAVVATGFGLYEIGSEVKNTIEGHSSWQKVGSTTVANVAEVGGGLLGFGAGELARQGVVEASKATLGEQNAPADAVSVGLAKDAWSAATAAVNKMKQNETTPQKVSGTVAAYPDAHKPIAHGATHDVLIKAQEAAKSAQQVMGSTHKGTYISAPTSSKKNHIDGPS
jgi:hypothetical protein